MKFRKFLVGTLAAAVLASNFAFAAPAPQVDSTDKNVKKAVERLAALNIVAGKEDGKYHEEDQLTRAEFAKLVVESLGLGDAAKVPVASTGFKDVAANHWAAGYVTVATGQGIIKGVGAGKFAPDAKVTYAEAITMLVRALGYKESFLTGTWPGNYIAKAAQEKITDDLTITASGVVDRGSAAILVDNTLDAEVVEQTSFGSNNDWTKVGKLFAKKLKLTKYEDVKIIKTPNIDGGLKAKEVNVENLGKFEVIQEGINVNDLLGQQADIYIKKVGGEEKIAYVDVKVNKTDAVYGVFDETDKAEYNLEFADGTDKNYDVDFSTSSSAVYVDGVSTTDRGDTLAARKPFGKFILNSSGKITYADLYDFNDSDDNEAVVVKEVNADKKYVRGLSGTVSTRKVDFNKEDGGFKVFLVQGKATPKEIAIADIKVGDVIYTTKVEPTSGDAVTYAYVVRNTVTGKLDSVQSKKFKVAGKEYDTAGKTLTTYSLDADKKDPKKYDEDVKNLENAIGSNVTAYLDIYGNIRHIATEAAATTDTLYGIVTKNGYNGSDGNTAVKLFNSKAEKPAYAFDDDKTGVTATGDVKEGDIVTYELNKSGKLDEDEYVKVATLDTTKTAKVVLNGTPAHTKIVEIKDFEDEKDYIVDTNNNKYFITSDTVLMGYLKSDNATVDPETVTWADIKKSSVTGKGIHAVVVSDDNDLNAKFVVFTANYKTQLNSSAKVAYVKSDIYYDGDYKVDVTLADGTDKTYKLTDAAEATKDARGNKVGKKQFMVFATNGSGEISSVAKAVYGTEVYSNDGSNIVAFDGDYKVVSGNVETFKDGAVRIKSGDAYKVDSATAVYVAQLFDKGDSDNLKKADVVTKGDSSDIEEMSGTNTDTGMIRLIVKEDKTVVMAIVLKY